LDIEANPEYVKFPPLDPLRKIRRMILNAINALRNEEDLPPVELDPYINETATKYAEFCAGGEVDGNQAKLTELITASTAPGEYKGITGYRYLGEEEKKNAKLMINKFFLEAYGLTFEINETRDEILKPEYTHVGIGLASSEEIYVVTEVFSSKLLIVNNIKVTDDEKGVEVQGKLTTDQMGPYAVRVVNEAHTPPVVVALVGPDNMQLDLETRNFQVFIDKPEIMFSSPPLICEVYLRQKPQSIEYGKEPASDLEKNLVYLKLSYKTPVEPFPDPRVVVEESKEKVQQEQEELARRKVSLKL
jgi:hypothetical protein